MTSPRPRGPWLALLAGSLVVALGVPLYLWASRPSTSVGFRPPAAAPSAEAPAGGSAGGAAAASPSAREPVAAAPAPTASAPPAVPVTPGLIGELPPPPVVVAPSTVRVERIGVRAAVDAIGVAPGSDAMEIPDDPARVGWYAYGPAPGGEAGVAILTAHVDSARTGPGAFFRLRELEPGDTVTVDTADGRALVYDVTGREQVGKEALPAQLYRRDGAPALALVTCGVRFDPVTRHYSDNVIVWAVPRPA